MSSPVTIKTNIRAWSFDARRARHEWSRRVRNVRYRISVAIYSSGREFAVHADGYVFVEILCASQHCVLKLFSSTNTNIDLTILKNFTKKRSPRSREQNCAIEASSIRKRCSVSCKKLCRFDPGERRRREKFKVTIDFRAFVLRRSILINYLDARSGAAFPPSDLTSLRH